MKTRSWMLAAVCASAAACGWSEVTPPEQAPDETENTAAANVQYSATVKNIEILRGTPPFIAILRIQNAGRQMVTLTYPASCPVRIRLYREADSVRVYDETVRPCGSETTATLRLAPGQQWDIGSGVRYPATVAGDSLEPGSYIVRVVPQTAHDGTVEIVAGTFVLAPPGS